MGESDAGLTRLTHRIASSPEGDLVLVLEGELDIANTEALRAALADLIPSVSGTLVVDVERLSFADSSAIALWVGWSQLVPRLEVRNPGPMVGRVIQAMGLAPILNPS